MTDPSRIDYQTDPSQYRHWRLRFEGPVATLAADFDENAGLRPGYKLKLNSYDLGVDIELNDAVNRIRFEHPEVRTVVITSASDKVCCSGANIFMLGLSSHAWKVNFCKFTSETRNGLEGSSRHSGLKFLAAVNGSCAGGGYELALACDEIIVVDDRNSAFCLPEVPLLGVLPATGGSDPRDRQAPCAPRPGRHLLHHHRGRARPEGQGLAAGRRHRKAGTVCRQGAGACARTRPGQ
jgi:benzoyl-CoA-dihydrodiol lyase